MSRLVLLVNCQQVLGCRGVVKEEGAVICS